MVEGRRAPSLHDEYLIYQALLGGLPSDTIVTDEFRERFPKYLTKALYEARTETRWDKPDAHYENACLDFASSLLAPGSDFLKDFSPFAAHVIEKSIPASLSHLLLKLTVPGVPDICQDAESWDLSFVDHYNRRPVDFNRRWEMLKSLQVEKAKGKAALAAFLSARAPEGASKLFVIQQTLRLRNMKPLLFSKGVYIPVPASASHLAFLRRYNEEWVLIVVPLIAAPPERSASIRLPDNAPHNWTNLFTGEKVQRGPEPIFCAEKSLLPVALYTAAAASPEAARRVH
jgi:(1->4)-alpha-D-glucan 1-alpha-D-glucosylmutase